MPCPLTPVTRHFVRECIASLILARLAMCRHPPAVTTRRRGSPSRRTGCTSRWKSRQRIVTGRASARMARWKRIRDSRSDAPPSWRPSVARSGYRLLKACHEGIEGGLPVKDVARRLLLKEEPEPFSAMGFR